MQNKAIPAYTCNTKRYFSSFITLVLTVDTKNRAELSTFYKPLSSDNLPATQQNNIHRNMFDYGAWLCIGAFMNEYNKFSPKRDSKP